MKTHARRAAARRGGFTLVEVLIAVVIITILGAVAGVNVMNQPQRARAAAARVQLNALKTAVMIYAADNRAHPTQRQGLEALVSPSAIPPEPAAFAPGGYLDSTAVPKDPWGRDYAYLVPGRQGEPFEIVCYGADGAEGGAGFDADLSSSAATD